VDTFLESFIITYNHLGRNIACPDVFFVLVLRPSRPIPEKYSTPNFALTSSFPVLHNLSCIINF